MKKVIYVMDPHCGWCYGNSENITSIYNQFKNDFEFELMVGGMWLGTNAPKGGAGLSDFIRTHSTPLINKTGVDISNQYYNLAADQSYAFSSLEPSAAIVLVKQLAPQKVFQFAKEVQLATFQKGLKLNELATYIPILENLGLHTKTFEEEWMQAENVGQTQAEFKKASQLANGFPATLLQDNDQYFQLASGYFDKEGMAKHLEKLM